MSTTWDVGDLGNRRQRGRVRRKADRVLGGDALKAHLDVVGDRTGDRLVVGAARTDLSGGIPLGICSGETRTGSSSNWCRPPIAAPADDLTTGQRGTVRRGRPAIRDHLRRLPVEREPEIAAALDKVATRT